MGPAAAVLNKPWQADGSQDIACCFNSPYGEALLQYCNYAIETLGLDGIWFDGSAWTPIWNRPLPLTCACSFCKARFKANTGLELPAKADWKDPVFRRWVSWRYAQFGGYIGNALKVYAPPPLDLDAPPQVRLGVFETADQRLLVHLHNRQGALTDWQQPAGPAAALRCRIPVQSATLLPGGTALPVSREGDQWVVKVPAVGLYEVVELRR